MRSLNRLKDSKIKQAKSSDKGTLSDGGGLELRISKTNSKTWVLKYTQPVTKKRTNLSIGSYPAISLSEARKKALEAKMLIANGIDPKLHRNAEREAEIEALQATFAVIAEKWFSLKLHEVKEETAKENYQMLKRHVLPMLANVPVADIRPKHLIKTLELLRKQDKLATIKKLCRIVNEIMRLAVAGGHIEINYLSDVTKLFPAPKKVNQKTIATHRLSELMQALERANLSDTTRCMIEWQLHTMTRPSEAASAKWEHFNVEEKVWEIPAEVMKMKRPHKVPLTDQALGILDKMKSRVWLGEYVFPNHRDCDRHANAQTANATLKRIGFEDLTAHGLRSLASTTLNEQGFDPDVIEAALAHVDRNEVRRTYNRTDYLARRKPLMSWWSEHIEQAKKGEVTTSSARNLKVV